jgi:hypothetical protein
MSAALLLATMLPTPAGAQHVHGHIIDAASGASVEAALVQLIAPDSTVLASVVSRATGAFAFGRTAPGEHFLRVTRIGYAELRERLDRVQTVAGEYVILLEPAPVELAGVEARASRNRWLDAHGFYDRQRLGFGSFVTRDMIETRFATATRPGEILRTLAAVTIETDFEGETVLIHRSRARLGGDCPAAVFVDGLNLGRRVPRLHPIDIEAMEFYRGPAELPARFGGAEAACGVVVIWLRSGAG